MRLTRLRTLGKAFYENPTTQVQAVEQFRQALQLNPKSAQDRLNYGLALLRAGRTPEGIAELEAVQKADPSLPHSWFNLGIEFKKQGDTAKAITQLERMAQLVPSEPITQYNLGALYKAAGRNPDAIAKFELAAKLDPNLAAPHFQLFNAYRAAGRAEDAKRELARFQELKKKQEEAGTGNEDVEWSIYSEVYEVVDPRLTADSTAAAALRFEVAAVTGKVDASSVKLVALDVDNDAAPDAVVGSAGGLQIWKSGLAPMAQPAFSALKDVRAVAPGDFDNDGLADLCVVDAAGASLYRNVAGKFVKAPVALPVGAYQAAVWVDYDHDYDQDLLLLGEKSILLRNQGAAGFVARPADLPLDAGRAIDGVVFRVVPDSKANDIAVSYADRPAVIYRDRLGGRYEAQPLKEVPAGSRGLQVVDINNDSRLDLLFGGGIAVNKQAGWSGIVLPKGRTVPVDFENRGVEDLLTARQLGRNSGKESFPASTVDALPDAAAWLPADFDNDGRLDVFGVLADGTLRRALNRSVTKNGWVKVQLKGIKNLRLAFNSEVELKAGLLYEKKLYRGTPLLFGTRAATDIDTIRITWPNGLIQNEIHQKPGILHAYEEAQRLSGSCPVIWTWNGKEFEYITDVLGVAPLGASSGDGQYFPLDHDEYVWIDGSALIPRNGELEVRITEELSEVSYLDQIELIAVDHPAGTEVFTNDKWKSPPFPEFRLFGGGNRVLPVRATEDDGRDVTAKVRARDREYADGFRHDMQGVAERHTLTLDFGRAARENRAVLILRGWVDWADGSTFLAQSQVSPEGLQPPKLQVKDGAGKWVTVLNDMGMPAGKPKTIAVDLTGKFLSASREVRIVTNLCVFWDEIFLLENSAAPEARLTTMAPAETDLRFRGFSATKIHPRREQPEEFSYAAPAATSLWNPTPGLYTRYGEVTPLVRDVDDRLVIMGSGDELQLKYDARRLPTLPQGWRRDWLLKVDGWAKDRDANTAYSQSVTPLPYHGMASYPYAPGDRYPDTSALREYRLKYNTRPALRLLRPLHATGTFTKEVPQP